MVDTNVIFLEGVGLYIVLVIILIMVSAIAALALSVINQNEEIKRLNATITSLKVRNAALNRENFRYRLKHGELDPGKEQ